MLGIKVAGFAPELEGKPGPERRVTASGIKVPARASRGPDGVAHFLLYLSIECLLPVEAYLDGLHVPSLHRVQAIQNVFDLGLDHKDHRIVTKPRVGADEQEEIGEPGDSRPFVSTRAWVPLVSE